MSEKKTIQINTDLFKVSEKNTSRKRQSAPNIKIKSPEKKQRDKTLRKNVLKMIREKQQEEYKRLFDKSEIKNSSQPSSNKAFNKDFDESLDFFSSLEKKHQNIQNNTTFKNYPNMNSVLMQPNTPIFIDTNNNVNNELPKAFNPIPTNEIVQIIKPKVQYPQPSYGCLKSGSLPTYRHWHQQTQRLQPQNESYNQIPINNKQHNGSYQGPIFTPSNSQQPIPDVVSPLNFLENQQTNNIREQMNMRRDPSEIIQKHEKQQTIFNGKSQNRIKYLKRKKIFKRTYHVGRSKIKPQIGVLVSNRTIRNRISTDAQLLKQTPIQDVRKFLIKKGFIKIGTNAPNDVLRKMYESVSLVCGEIQNHNPENLLFNFVNDTVQ